MTLNHIQYVPADKWLPFINSCLISVRFILNPINNAIIKQPPGNMILLTRKSEASKTVNRKILKFSRVLDDNAAGIPAMKTIKPANQATFFRERCFFAVNAAVIISNILNDEVKIANRSNSKNKLKKTSPNGICAKASGKTT